MRKWKHRSELCASVLRSFQCTYTWCDQTSPLSPHTNKILKITQKTFKSAKSLSNFCFRHPKYQIDQGPNCPPQKKQTNGYQVRGSIWFEAIWAPSVFLRQIGPRQIGPRKMFVAANWAPEIVLVANWSPEYFVAANWALENWAPANWAPEFLLAANWARQI